MAGEKVSQGADSMADRARDHALFLTRHGSVTGSAGELSLPQALAARLKAAPALAAARIFTLPAPGDGLERSCLAVLVRGTGRETVLLTGHFDTVTEEDYGALRPLATDPLLLKPALIRALEQIPGPDRSAKEALALADLVSGDYLPGRGLLDMKAGLAAGLAALEVFAETPSRRGNLLFVAVPDEEVNSAGARALAAALPEIEAREDLRVVAAINLDCIGDEGDGRDGQVVALGSVGKLLATTLAIGAPTHASHAFQGLNAGALSGAIAARLEWAPELADTSGGDEGIPPLLLGVKDSKRHYDVTTPSSVFSIFNILSQGRSATETMAILEQLLTETVASFRATLQARRDAVLGHAGGPVPEVAILRASTLIGDLSPEARRTLSDSARALAGERLSLPDQNQRLTEQAFALSGRRGPAVILGLGSLPYLPVSLGTSETALRLSRAVDAGRAEISAATGSTIGLRAFFPGISDMSFLGEAEAGELALLKGETPAWESGIGWTGAVGQVPTINIGPWGRDFHTPLERLYTPYAFSVLPRLLLAVADRMLGTGDGSQA